LNFCLLLLEATNEVGAEQERFYDFLQENNKWTLKETSKREVKKVPVEKTKVVQTKVTEQPKPVVKPKEEQLITPVKPKLAVQLKAAEQPKVNSQIVNELKAEPKAVEKPKVIEEVVAEQNDAEEPKVIGQENVPEGPKESLSELILGDTTKFFESPVLAEFSGPAAVTASLPLAIDESASVPGDSAIAESQEANSSVEQPCAVQVPLVETQLFVESAADTCQSPVAETRLGQDSVEQSPLVRVPLIEAQSFVESATESRDTPVVEAKLGQDTVEQSPEVQAPLIEAQALVETTTDTNQQPFSESQLAPVDVQENSISGVATVAEAPVIEESDHVPLLPEPVAEAKVTSETALEDTIIPDQVVVAVVASEPVSEVKDTSEPVLDDTVIPDKVVVAVVAPEPVAETKDTSEPALDDAVIHLEDVVAPEIATERPESVTDSIQSIPESAKFLQQQREKMLGTSDETLASLPVFQTAEPQDHDKPVLEASPDISSLTKVSDLAAYQESPVSTEISDLIAEINESTPTDTAKESEELPTTDSTFKRDNPLNDLIDQYGNFLTNSQDTFTTSQDSFADIERQTEADKPAQKSAKAPVFSQKLVDQEFQDRDNIHLDCFVEGHTPILVEWLHEGEPVLPAEDSNVEIYREAGVCSLEIIQASHR